VAVLVRVERIGLDELVSVHTSPPVNTSTANNAAANRTWGRRYHGSGVSAAGGGASGGRNSICGRAPVASRS
jgi:hypothetical protein